MSSIQPRALTDNELVNYSDLLFNGNPPPAWQTEIMRRFVALQDKAVPNQADPRQLTLF